MLKVWRCCLLKSKIKYQPSKDLKTFSSVESVFFFESTFQATLHKMRNFEKFSQILDCGHGKVLHKIAWSIVCIDRRRFQKTLRQLQRRKSLASSLMWKGKSKNVLAKIKTTQEVFAKFFQLTYLLHRETILMMISFSTFSTMHINLLETKKWGVKIQNEKQKLVAAKWGGG